MKTPLKAVCVGAGYFSRFQYESWSRIPEVDVVANCNRSVEKAEAMAADYDIPRSYGVDDFGRMLDEDEHHDTREPAWSQYGSSCQYLGRSRRESNQ